MRLFPRNAAPSAPRRRAVKMAVGVGLAGTALAGLATAAHAAPRTVIDTDQAKVAVSGGHADFGRGDHNGTAPPDAGSVEWFMADGHVQGLVSGYVYWDDSTSGGCARAVAKFFYGDNSTSTVKSPAVCRAGSGRPVSTSVSMASDASKDVTRMELRTEGSVDTNFTSTGTQSYGPDVNYVGDAPQSDGTCNSLDQDKADLNVGGKQVLAANTVWRCIGAAGYNVRSDVYGDLYWKDTMAGACAQVKATWTYYDGTTSSQTSAQACRDFNGEKATVYLKSDQTKDAVQVDVKVESGQPGHGFTTQVDQGMRKLGDA